MASRSTVGKMMLTIPPTTIFPKTTATDHFIRSYKRRSSKWMTERRVHWCCTALIHKSAYVRSGGFTFIRPPKTSRPASSSLLTAARLATEVALSRRAKSSQNAFGTDYKATSRLFATPVFTLEQCGRRTCSATQRTSPLRFLSQ